MPAFSPAALTNGERDINLVIPRLLCDLRPFISLSFLFCEELGRSLLREGSSTASAHRRIPTTNERRRRVQQL